MLARCIVVLGCVGPRWRLIEIGDDIVGLNENGVMAGRGESMDGICV